MRCWSKIQGIASKIPGVERVVTVSGISILDNRASLANAGVAFVVLKDWDVRLKEKGQDLRSIYLASERRPARRPEAFAFAVLPPPIQGIGNVGGFTMQVELRNGDFDYAAAAELWPTRSSRNGNAQSRSSGSPRLSAPARRNSLSRSTASRRRRSASPSARCSAALSGYVGSNYVGQITKFGHVFQIYTQANANYRANVDDIRNLKVKAGDGTMTPIGTVVDVKEVQGPSLISLYNLYPTATVVGGPAPGFSSGQALDIMDQIAAHALPTGTGFDWTAMSYQEKQVGNQTYYVFGFADPGLFRAGRTVRELDPAVRRASLPCRWRCSAPSLRSDHLSGADNNLYTQIGIILLIALGSKNAILIVEYARQQRAEGKAIPEAAVEAARLRFRPIIMTSFAFILGVLPLVLATGAGAAARRSIGIAVFCGMIASTCLVVVFVPSFYVVMQWLEERRKGKPAPKAAPPIR